MSPGEEVTYTPGMTCAVSPTIGDVHAVRNAFDDKVSIGIHVYGSNIGAQRRHTFNLEDGAATEFISSYSSDKVPNLWVLSGATKQ